MRDSVTSTSLTDEVIIAELQVKSSGSAADWTGPSQAPIIPGNYTVTVNRLYLDSTGHVYDAS